MTPAPKRRWFLFSLRMLFVLMTIAASFATWCAWELNERARLRVTILTSPNVGLIWDPTGTAIRYVDLRSTHFSERDLRRAQTIFSDARVMRTRPGDWDYLYRNPSRRTRC